MSSSIPSSNTQVFQGFAEQFYSRKFLLHTPIYRSPDPAAAPPASGASQVAAAPYPAENTFDANVVMVLSVLLCALICSLGLNFLIRCAFRCSRFVALEANQTTSAGLANKGIKKKALKTFPTVSYSTGLSLPGLDTECVICLSEFTPGERLKVLPKCNHGFHVRCIDKWLNSHSSCPTCRQCLIETCQKIVGGCSVQDSSSTPVESVLNIAPLEPEGVIRNYRGVI